MAAPVSPSNNQNPDPSNPVGSTPVNPSPTVVTPQANPVPPVKPEDMTLAQKIGPIEEQPGSQTQPAANPNTLPPLPTQEEALKPAAPKEEIEDEDDEEDDDEPQVVERVIIKEKSGLGCFGLIKRLTCFCLLFFLLFIAAIVALIVFKPAFITEPLKTFLNGNYTPAEVSEGISNETVENYIDEVTSPTDGEVTFQLTEDQITTLVRSRLSDGADVRVGLEENKIQVFTDIAQSGGPLWLIVELSDTGDKLNFSRMGLGRINTPAPLRDFVKDRAFSFIGSIVKDLKFDNSEQLVNGLVGSELEEGVTIKDVKFSNDLVLVTVEL